MADTTSSTPSSLSAGQASVQDGGGAGQLPPIVYLVAAIILGLIVGKFIL